MSTFVDIHTQRVNSRIFIPSDLNVLSGNAHLCVSMMAWNSLLASMYEGTLPWRRRQV